MQIRTSPLRSFEGAMHYEPVKIGQGNFPVTVVLSDISSPTERMPSNRAKPKGWGEPVRAHDRIISSAIARRAAESK